MALRLLLARMQYFGRQEEMADVGRRKLFSFHSNFFHCKKVFANTFKQNRLKVKQF